MEIGIYGKTITDNFVVHIKNLLARLQDANVHVSVYKSFYTHLKDKHQIPLSQVEVFEKREDIKPTLDVLISIGGDGTFLELVSMVKDKGIPIAGINSGRLGFLANISRDEIGHAIEIILNKEYTTEKRTLIKLEASPGESGEDRFALNEITVQKKNTTMVTVHTYIDKEYLNSYWADGLIIATPTGSTAYSLSVGGPIISPTSNNFIITPIAPHTLTVRPLVVPDDKEITLEIESRDSKYIASVDHRFEIFNTLHQIKLRKADYLINLVQLPGTSFYSTIRNKLMWGLDRRN